MCLQGCRIHQVLRYHLECAPGLHLVLIGGVERVSVLTGNITILLLGQILVMVNKTTFAESAQLNVNLLPDHVGMPQGIMVLKQSGEALGIFI